MSLFSSSPIGLQLTDTFVRAVHCRGGKVRTKGEKNLSPGMIVEGVIADPVKVGEFLKSFVASLEPAPKTNQVVLCLPPEKVYTQLIDLPHAKKKEYDTILREKLQNLIPEDANDLVITSKVLSSSPQGVRFAVAAVRNDVLQGALQACSEAGLMVVRVTTPACAIAEMMRRKDRKEPFLLVDTATGSTDRHTATVFYQDWPVDEAVFIGDGERIHQTVTGLLDDCLAKAFSIGSVVTLGSVPAVIRHTEIPEESLEEKEEKTQEGTPPVKEEMKGPTNVIVLEDTLNALKDVAPEWAAAVGASLMRKKDLVLRFLVKPGHHRARAEIYLLGFMLGVAVFGAVWYWFRPPPPLPPCPAEKVTFVDVSSTDGYFRPIEWGVQQGILRGTEEGTFEPERTITRSEFLKIVLEASGTGVSLTATGSSGFPDVEEEAWYGPYVRHGERSGIIEGYPDGTFRPTFSVTVAEALKMTYGTLGVETEDIGGEWYERYYEHAKSNNILYSTELKPHQYISRQDVVWIVWRVLNPEEEAYVLPTEGHRVEEVVEPEPEKPCIPLEEYKAMYGNF